MSSQRPTPWLETAVFCLAAVTFVLRAPGGPGWGPHAAHALAAVQLDRTAASPLYDLCATIAAWLPVGEPGFRIAALDALLAALALAAVVDATRAWVPKLPAAGVMGAALLAIAPPWAGATGPSLLAALGAIVALGAALRATRAAGAAAPGTGGARDAIMALGGVTLVIGAAPWLGLAALAALVPWLVRGGVRRDAIALGLVGVGVTACALWAGAIGALPRLAPDLALVIGTSGRGAGAVVVGAGLLGAAFAAATGLPGARALLGAIVVAGAHAILIDDAARGTPMLALLAIGAALIPVAMVRAAGADTTGRRALLWPLGAGLPLLGVGALAGVAGGGTRATEAPARVATALLDPQPPGPGVFVTSRPTSWSALSYASAIAGARPDVTVVPPIAPDRADVVLVTALRMDRRAGADVAALGRLDPALARPRGRGFEVLLAAPAGPRALAVPPPAYGAGELPSAASAAEDAAGSEAIAEALERARYEAATGRLDHAARAVGLAARFGAADLALLASTQPTIARPALYDFVPRLGLPDGTWQLDLFGDDLAWVAGLPLPAIPADAPAPRRLHALWCAILATSARADDPRVLALGEDAVTATAAMLREVGPRPPTTAAGH